MLIIAKKSIDLSTENYNFILTLRYVPHNFFFVLLYIGVLERGDQRSQYVGERSPEVPVCQD